MGADNTFGETNFNPNPPAEGAEAILARRWTEKYPNQTSGYGRSLFKEIHSEWVIAAMTEFAALISENYYPKEFTEWVGQNNAILCYVNIRKIWVRTRFVLGENPHEEYDEYTTEQLFNYWKENEQ